MEFTINTIGSTIFQCVLVGKEDKPDEFVIKMITNNEIDGLLPLSVIRKDMDMELRYNITSLLTLSQMMQEPLNKKKVLNILKSIVSAATQAEEYMLDVTGLVLDEEKIYVNIATGEAKLIYLPVTNEGSCDVISFVKRLITCLQFDQNEDSSYILQFMNAFNSGSITTVAELAEFLLSMEKKEGKGSSTQQTSSSTNRSLPKQATAGIVNQPISNIQPKQEQEQLNKPSQPVADGGIKKNSAHQPVSNVSNQPVGGISTPARPAMAIPGIPNVPGSKPVQETGNEKSSKHSFLFGKPKEKQEEKPKNKLFGKKEKSGSGKTPAFAVPGMNDLSGLPLTPFEELGTNQPVSTPKQPVDKQPASYEPVEGNNNWNQPNVQMPGSMPNMDYGNTIMLNQNNSVVTVMLDENGLDSDEPARASITRVANNQKMYMDKDILKIGKESDYVDFYIGNNPTISRAHADIIRKEGKYYIRDNNSKNHTYVNDEMIPPSQLIPISNNTRIRLANEELIFQLV